MKKVKCWVILAIITTVRLMRHLSVIATTPTATATARIRNPFVYCKMNCGMKTKSLCVNCVSIINEILCCSYPASRHPNCTSISVKETRLRDFTDTRCVNSVNRNVQKQSTILIAINIMGIIDVAFLASSAASVFMIFLLPGDFDSSPLGFSRRLFSWAIILA